MADKKISALTAETSPEAADLAHIVTDLGTTATNKKVTLETLFNKIPTTIGYNTEAVSAVTMSASTQALDGKALFLITGTAATDCIATMSAGDHVGQTITHVLVATAGNSCKITPNSFLDHSGGSNTAVNLVAVGDGATLVWTGSNWIVTSLVGTAVTAS